MSIIELNLKPDYKTVKDFGWISAIAGAVLALILYFTGRLSAGYCSAIAGFGLFTWFSSLLCPSVTKWIFIILTVITFPIGLVVSFIVLSIFYYLIITPTGIIFKILGRDVLCRKWQDKQESYWVKHKTTEDIKQYFRQF